MASGVGRLAEKIPGGAADVQATWPSPDRMALVIHVMGQGILTQLDVEERLVRVSIDLPSALTLLKAPIVAIVRRSGEEMLLDDQTGN